MGASAERRCLIQYLAGCTVQLLPFDPFRIVPPRYPLGLASLELPKHGLRELANRVGALHALARCRTLDRYVPKLNGGRHGTELKGLPSEERRRAQIDPFAPRVR
jgi:hypothetical protein